MPETVIGVFHNTGDAKDAIAHLREAGYDPQDISILMRDVEGRAELKEDTGANVVSGTASGAVTGGILGGLAGLVAAVAIPGLGAFFVGGPIASALGLTGAAATTASGVATGAVAGGLLGALTGLGLSEEDALRYERYVKEGAALVAVPARMREEEQVKEIFEDHGSADVTTVSLGEETEGYMQYPTYAPMGAKGGRSKRKTNGGRTASRRTSRRKA